MELFCREYGEAGKPMLIVIHGLLGSSRNWQAAAKDLAVDFQVFCKAYPLGFQWISGGFARGYMCG